MATASTFRADLTPEWQAAWHLASAVTDRALSQGLATHLGASFIGQAVGPCLISDAARTSIPAAQPSCRRLAPLRHELHLGMVAVALAQSSEPAGPASGQGRVAHPFVRSILTICSQRHPPTDRADHRALGIVVLCLLRPRWWMLLSLR